VAAEHEHLAAALHDTVSLVRANACLLIGNSEAPVSTETLRTLRDSDPDETVRQRASWALTQLS
jgi:hypothetical protein